MPRFRDKAFEKASLNDSRIILAFDKHYLFREGMSYQLFKEALYLLNSLRGIIAGVKIGLPTLLTLGEDGVYRLINEYDWGFFFIADLKTADVPHINRAIIDHIADLGFDAMIVHAVIGFKDGLEAVVDRAGEYGLGILSLLSMTHRGADEIINKYFTEALEASLKADVDGFILPANRPDLIRYVRNIAGEKVIASPGVGAQGARFGAAVDAGADFEIIGRSIYQADSPSQAAEEIRGVLRWRR